MLNVTYRFPLYLSALILVLLQRHTPHYESILVALPRSHLEYDVSDSSRDSTWVVGRDRDDCQLGSG